jgi:predicted dehydrogenase
VLCEKPMAMSVEECRAMVDAAERSGAVLLCLPYDATPAFRAALQHLNEATMGVFTGAEAQLLLPGVSRDNWYFDQSVAGGGAGLDTLVYPVSRLIGLLGPARRVHGFVNTLIPHRILGDGATIDVVPPPRDHRQGKTVEPTVDDNATLVLEWENGQQAVARALWGTSILRNDTVVYGRHATMWLSAGDVVIHSPEAEIPGAESIEWNGYPSCYRIPFEASARIEDEGLVEHLVDCIQGRARPTCPGEQTLHVHEILFRGYEAARIGRAQELETTFTPWHEIDPAFHDTRSRFL